MKVSKRCHYALRALVDLGIAQALGRPLVQIGDLAQKENLPLGFLGQIFIQLRRAGFIESKRGTKGGYLLAVPASEIRYGEIIRLLEGDSLGTACSDCAENAACPYPDPSICGLHCLMSDIAQAVNRIVAPLTLADTVRRSLRKIRCNKTAVPFVQMVMERQPGKRVKTAARSAKKTAKLPKAKARGKPIRTRQSL